MTFNHNSQEEIIPNDKPYDMIGQQYHIKLKYNLIWICTWCNNLKYADIQLFSMRLQIIFTNMQEYHISNSMQICQNSHFRNESRCNQEQGKKKDKYWHMSQLYDQHQFFFNKDWNSSHLLFNIYKRLFFLDFEHIILHTKNIIFVTR